MKKTILLLLVAIAVTGYRVNANTVSEATAQTIALNFFKVTAVTGNATLTATLNYTRTESDNTVDFYVFNMAPAGGFVIVSANDNATPILGYSTKGSFNAGIAPRIGLSDWMNHTAKKIYHTIQQNIQADTRIKGLWTAYLQGQDPNVLRSAGVAPLLGDITWDQENDFSNPPPYIYNLLCPYNSTDGERCVTGCVATAMAQVMKYWNYPAQGTGSYSYEDNVANGYSYNYGEQSANFGATTYNWANMPDALTLTTTASQDSAVDLLMYDCGVAVAMDYGDDNEDGSGAEVLQDDAGPGQPCAQAAYITYFSYNPNTIQGVYESNYDSTGWLNTLENELNSGRVIQYEGEDLTAGGHTWVCDGYDASNLVHMNWGWGGYDNGFFAVSNLDAGGYNFDAYDAALIGIEPMTPLNIAISPANPVTCPGLGVTLTAQGPASASYSWTPTQGLSCSTCATTSVNPAYSGATYFVTADSAGVTGSASIVVTVYEPVAAAFSIPAISTCSVPVNIPFINSSTNAVSYLWNFGDGSTSTDINPVHSYNAFGTYTVTLVASNSCGIDSTNGNQTVEINDKTPVAQSQNICAGQSATLTATGTGNLSWYDAPTGGNLIDTGNSFTTPALDNTTTYYVSSTIPASINSVGPVNDAISAGGYFQNVNPHEIIFNCSLAQTLLTVDVYSQIDASRTIQLWDSNNNVLQTITVNIPAGLQTVTLNMPIPAEDNLQLVLAQGTAELYRDNAGINFYPYTSTDGTLVLTGSDAGPGYYYYFYNWKLQQAPCITNTAAVAANVISPGQNSFTTTVSGVNTLNFIPSASGTASFSWSFGDGVTSTLPNPSHTYATGGTYNVQMIVSNGSCSDTVVQSVTTVSTGINNLNSSPAISLYPNPAKDLLVLNINSGSPLSYCAIDIRNILGETIMTKNTSLNSGQNIMNLDISALASGVYLVVFQSGKETITKRFVKAN